MHYGPPSTAIAQNAAGHVHPDQVTGPCYKPTGVDCTSTYHFVHGGTSLSLAGDCPNLNQCIFGSDVTLTGSAIFANTNYDCHAFGTDSTGDGVVIQAFAGTGSVVRFGFRNETGSTILANTIFTINFTCDGA
jgi:hypothetical protein